MKLGSPEDGGLQPFEHVIKPGRFARWPFCLVQKALAAFGLAESRKWPCRQENRPYRIWARNPGNAFIRLGNRTVDVWLQLRWFAAC